MTPTRAWLALLRPPNLFTVPGDVLAGYFLAAGAGGVVAAAGLPIVAVAGLLFYAAGLLLNDWADVQVDQAERPDRPLPAGLVPRRQVAAAAAALLVIALGLCWWQGGVVLLTGVGLTAAIATYNLLTKSIPFVGPLNMGLCRGLNFLLGATLAAGFLWPNLAWWGLAALVAYITAVTHLARREMTGRYNIFERWLPAAILVAAFFAYLPLSQLIDWPAQVAVALLFLAAAAGAGRVARLLPNRQGIPADPLAPAIPAPALIGRLISYLLPLQAAFIVGSGDGIIPFLLALVILCLWPFKRTLGKVFYSS